MATSKEDEHIINAGVKKMTLGKKKAIAHLDFDTFYRSLKIKVLDKQDATLLDVVSAFQEDATLDGVAWDQTIKLDGYPSIDYWADGPPTELNRIADIIMPTPCDSEDARQSNEDGQYALQIGTIMYPPLLFDRPFPSSNLLFQDVHMVPFGYFRRKGLKKAMVRVVVLSIERRRELAKCEQCVHTHICYIKDGVAYNRNVEMQLNMQEEKGLWSKG